MTQQIPWKSLSISQMSRGQLPLWNPYQMAGYPLLANIQSSPFYPLNILLFISPFILSWSVFILLQQILAAFFMYLFLRNLKLERLSASLGSLSFAFCGFFIAWLEWGLLCILLFGCRLFYSVLIKSFLIKDIAGAEFLFCCLVFIPGRTLADFYLYVRCYIFILFI